MQDHPLLKAIWCSCGSLLSLSVLAVIVAGSPVAASDDAAATSDRQPVVGIEITHPAPKAVPKKKRTLLTQVAAPAPTLLAAVDQKDIRPRHRLLADAIIRALPSGCHQQLKNFYVRYDDPKKRGLGGTETIIIAGTEPGGKEMPDAEFVALIGHECGHLLHASLTGNAASGDSMFRDGKTVFHADSPFVAFASISWEREKVLRPGEPAANFCSGYGKSDAFEDFAECFALYVFQYPAFQARAAENPAMARKLAWMEHHLPTGLHRDIESDYAWNGTVPWDVTKLPYRWYKLDTIRLAMRPSSL